MTLPADDHATGDVLIVGGGIVGLCCAFALQRVGATVTVLERAQIGSGASSGNTGWIVPSLSTPLAAPGMLGAGLRSALDRRGALVIRPGLDTAWLRWLWQFRRSCTRDRYRAGVKALIRLNDRTLAELDAYRAAGVSFDMRSTGMLAVGRNRQGLAWFELLFEELNELGFDGVLERLDGDGARALEPALSRSVGAAMRTSVDRYVSPESLLVGLTEFLSNQGVVLNEGCPADGLSRSDGVWHVRSGTRTFTAEAVVIATGVSANDLLRGLGLQLPIVGAKGYSITLRGTGCAPRHALYLSEPKIGLSPFEFGLRIAGIFELPGRSADPDPSRVRQLVEHTLPYLADWRPQTGESVTEGWAGFRPATPDSLPFIGPVSGSPGVYLAAGHGMLGMTLAPATGAGVAEMIDSGRVPEWLDPFTLQRPI